ncbi:MAG: large conductance mechanosensitive channel protein MscL [Cyanobacteria bacterium HKST-UBA02]|nr:large conductance mechanosensitive channel protein MscL [Cyanobacteria bacterium HKST-UBA02]
MVSEFKEFAIKGNAMDMAVGMIVGVAFGKIVNSLVEDIIMPPIGKVMGNVDFTNLFINLGSGEFASLAAAKQAGAATINYGVFLNQVVSFLIVSMAVFALVKVLNGLKRERDAAKEAVNPEEPPRQEVLLSEIRDLLKARA